jgi:integrase
MPNILDMHSIDTEIEPYLERIYRISKSHNSKRGYKVALRNFNRFLISKQTTLKEIIVELKQNKRDPVILLDEYYTFMSENNLRNSTINGNLSISKDYLHFNGIKIYSEDLKQRFRPPKREVFYEEGLTKKELVRLLHNSSQKLQMAILITCSSGMRVGEITQLRLSDIDYSTNPVTIRIRRETTKTRETRFTHISKEAFDLLRDYIKKRQEKTNADDFYLFMNCEYSSDTIEYYDAFQAARCSLMTSLRKVVESIPELANKNENGQYRIHFHAFRKWFKTQVTNAHQSDFAEALMGHKSLKLVYYKQNSQDRLKTYQKIEPFLTISDNTSLEASIDNMENTVEYLKLELEKAKHWKESNQKYVQIIN